MRRADPLTDFIAGELRQAPVEDHEIGRFLGMAAERRLAVVRGHDLVSLLAEQRRDHSDEGALVVDDEDARQRVATAAPRASGTLNAKTAPLAASSTHKSPPCPSTTRRDA